MLFPFGFISNVFVGCNVFWCNLHYFWFHVFELSSLRVAHTYTYTQTPTNKKKRTELYNICCDTPATSIHYRRLPLDIRVSGIMALVFFFSIKKLAMHRMKIKWKLFTATCYLSFAFVGNFFHFIRFPLTQYTKVETSHFWMLTFCFVLQAIR